MEEILEMIERREHDFVIIDRAVALKVPVNIRYNNETGKFRWAVEIVGTDFWIDAFETKDEAIEYCKEDGLPVVEIISQ
jgi:hypothetical protein